MDRETMLGRLDAARGPWDVVVIGGGATGLGCAVDAARRGYRTALFERGDFASGTSSRSTKLIHGGVRYLRRGNVRLVLESLYERARLCANAPHLVSPLRFIVPAYRRRDIPFYAVGLGLYDLLAGSRGLGRSRWLSRAETLSRLETLAADGLRGGIVYHDAQFDDARLAVALAATAADLGATAINYAEVDALEKSRGAVCGVSVRDVETGRRFHVEARAVINATGVFADSVRQLDEPGARDLVRPSRGSHVVLDRAFLPGDDALMIPRTDDGRVLFAIPWKGRVVVGTTEVEVDATDADPVPSAAEVDFLLEHAGRYLSHRPTRADVRSAFAGLRPLVGTDPSVRASALPRDHEVVVSPSGLVTIVGGKWTTYRRMAEDTVDRAAVVGRLSTVPCATRELALHDTNADAIRALVAGDSALAQPVADGLEVRGDEVVWAARMEMARTVEDVLARRTRALFLDAAGAARAAPAVAALLAAELGRDDAWQRDQVRAFAALATRYCAA